MFKSIFLILSLLLTVMLMYMTFFMNQFIVKEQIDQLDRYHLQLLQDGDKALAQLFADMERQVRYLLTNSDSVQYMTNPQNSTPEQGIQILKTLDRLQESYPDVDAAFFFAPLADAVLSSSGYLTSTADAEISGLLQGYPAEQGIRIAPDLYQQAVVTADGIYLIYDFYPAQCLGRYVFQLNVSRLQDRIGTQYGPGGIFLVDGTGSVILSRDGLGSSTAPAFPLSDPSVFFTGQTDSRQQQHAYYQVGSAYPDWSLVMEMQPRAALYDHTSFWVLTIPMLLVLIVLSTLGAYALARQIYEPINRLTALVVRRSGQQMTTQTQDVDYLEIAYQRAWRENQALQHDFTGLRNTMRQYLFRETLAGTLEDGVAWASLLDLSPGGRFQVVLIRFETSSVALDAMINRNLQFSLVERALSQMSSCLCCIEQGKQVAALFYFQRGDDEQVVQCARQQLGQLRDRMREETQCPTFLGFGSHQSELPLVRSSYAKALEDLQYDSYMALDAEGKTAPSPDDSAAARLRLLIDDAILSKDPVELHCHEILRAIREGAPDPQALQHRYQMAENLLMEKLVMQNQSLQALPFELEHHDLVSEEDLLLFCGNALEQGRMYASQKKYRYVETGKRFIEDNYHNASLSTHDISEHVGISASYFSSLFNEITMDSVVSYMNVVRVRQAKELLRVTSIPVKEIGFRCGFNSANVFGRVFKRYTDLSPTQYRDQYAIPTRSGGVPPPSPDTEDG